MRRWFALAASSLLLTGIAMCQPCGGTMSTNASNFNGTSIKSGSYIWFNANFSASGIPASGATVYLTSSWITFTADQPYMVAAPNAEVVFDPKAVCASTTFDSAANTWKTTVPISGSDEVFLSGVAFPVPDSFANAGGKVQGPVVWQGMLASSVDGVTVAWKWGAAVYTNFSTDYNLIGVKPTHTNSCLYPNSDHAGTPQGIDPITGSRFKDFVVGGARGGGGSNWTGSWSGTVKLATSCQPIPL